MGTIDIALILAIAAVLGLGTWLKMRRKKMGKGGCGTSCAGCPMACDSRVEEPK